MIIAHLLRRALLEWVTQNEGRPMPAQLGYVFDPATGEVNVTTEPGAASLTIK